MGKLRRHNSGSNASGNTGNNSDPEMVYLDESCNALAPKNEVSHIDKHWEIMNQYIHTCSTHDMDGHRAIWDPLGVVKFTMGDLPVPVFWEELEKIMKSFPDSTCYVEGIELIFSDSHKGIFRVKKIGLTGTHTGEPYGFGPYEPIPATGIFVAPAPEFMHMTIVDGLVHEVQFLPHGQCSEPDGIYQLIGGQLQPSGEHIFGSERYFRSRETPDNHPL